jgi:hypothetical protein
VYFLAQEALEPIADQYIAIGDRLLLVNLDGFYGSDIWRFVPTPVEIPQDEYEGVIEPATQAKFKTGPGGTTGDSREVKYLKDAFELDSTKKIYKLKSNADNFDEVLLGRILSGVRYSWIKPFPLSKFMHRYPYFIDAFEGGLLSAVIKKQGKGFERLETADVDQTALANHRAAKMVFNTCILNLATWKEVQKKYSANKLLIYSVDNVIVSGTEYIGLQASFRLIDIANDGKLLWTGTKTLTSKTFPKDKAPFLGALRLTLPERVSTGWKDTLAKTLKESGAAFPMNAVLLKIDDIPVFGTYPVTREDFTVENALQGFFSSIRSVNIIEKLPKRLYKKPWQMAQAVHYMNPLLGGDYGEFQNYYGARYMIGYRILWKKIQGVQLLKGENSYLELSDKIVGIYVKIIDMADNGRILLSDFIPFVATSDELNQSILYRCYSKTQALSTVVGALHDSGALSKETHTVLINRRMEIANNYIGEGSQSEDFIRSRLPQRDQGSVLMSYYDVYEVLRTFGKEDDQKQAPETPQAGASREAEQPYDQEQELHLTMAINLMQSWFEDGLCTAMSTGGVAPNEKLDSLYSRYFIRRTVSPKDTSEELLYLSPLLLKNWGLALQSYYKIDKIIYFSLLETESPATQHIKTPIDSPLARFFPFVTYDPDSLLLSVVNVTSGDYEYKGDFSLK